MPVDLRESRLPGVGVKYTFLTAAGGRVSVIMHNDGQREVYFYRRRDDDDRDQLLLRRAGGAREGAAAP